MRDCVKVKLANVVLIVLLVLINTATCERLFSEWGLIHTSLRNRMDPQKVKRLSIVRAAVRAKDRAEVNLSTSRISSFVDTNSHVSRIVSPEEKPFKDSCLTLSDSEQQQTNDLLIGVDLVRNRCLLKFV